jgi:hypothetical protein
MTTPLFHLHIKGRGLMVTAGFGQKGTRLQVLRNDGSDLSCLASAVLKKAMYVCKCLNRIDLQAATAAINATLSDRCRAIYIKGDLHYPPRITLLSVEKTQ